MTIYLKVVGKTFMDIDVLRLLISSFVWCHRQASAQFKNEDCKTFYLNSVFEMEDIVFIVLTIYRSTTVYLLNN